MRFCEVGAVYDVQYWILVVHHYRFCEVGAVSNVQYRIIVHCRFFIIGCFLVSSDVVYVLFTGSALIVVYELGVWDFDGV